MNILSTSSALLPEACRSALQVGLSVLIQATLLLLAGLFAASAFRRRGPAFQSFVYKATLAALAAGGVVSILATGHIRTLCCLALPAARTVAERSEASRPGTEGEGANAAAGQPARKALRPEFPIRIEHADPTVRHRTQVAGMPAVPGMVAPSPAGFPAYLAVGTTKPSQYAPRPDRLYVAAAGLWLGGAVLQLTWLVLCYLYILRLRRRSVRISCGEAADTLCEICQSLSLTPPLLLASARVSSPSLTGVRRPAILLPASYETDFDGPTLRAILVHELTHLARNDCMWAVLCRVACAVVWIHPLAWTLYRRLEESGDEACDQVVLARNCSVQSYVTGLLRLAERLASSRRERAVGVGVAAFRSPLGRRVQRILDGSHLHTCAFSSRAQAAILLGTVSAGVVSLFIVSASMPPASQNTRQRVVVPSAGRGQATGRGRAVAHSMRDRTRIPDEDISVMVVGPRLNGRPPVQMPKPWRGLRAAHPDQTGFLVRANEMQRGRVADRLPPEGGRIEIAGPDGRPLIVARSVDGPPPAEAMPEVDRIGRTGRVPDPARGPAVLAGLSGRERPGEGSAAVRLPSPGGKGPEEGPAADRLPPLNPLTAVAPAMNLRGRTSGAVMVALYHAPAPPAQMDRDVPEPADDERQDGALRRRREEIDFHIQEINRRVLELRRWQQEAQGAHAEEVLRELREITRHARVLEQQGLALKRQEMALKAAEQRRMLLERETQRRNEQQLRMQQQEQRRSEQQLRLQQQEQRRNEQQLGKQEQERQKGERKRMLLEQERQRRNEQDLRRHAQELRRRLQDLKRQELDRDRTQGPNR